METTIQQILDQVILHPGVRATIDLSERFITIHLNYRDRVISHKCTWSTVADCKLDYIPHIISRLAQDLLPRVEAHSPVKTD